jgi:dephospho-CoA kinase
LLRVGLTGGIACGKSHVLRRLGTRGIATLDLDRVAHQVMAPGGPAYDEVVAGFGRDILAEGGAIDRKALGAVVFADAEARGRLNAIVHPKVRAEEARVAAGLAEQGHDLLVTDAALLVEAGLHLRFDRLVVVHCSRQQQLRRLQERDGLGHAQAASRIDAQMPVAEKRRFAHYQVATGTTVSDTDRTADVLSDELRRLAKSPLRRVDHLVERGVACLLAAQADARQRLDPIRLIEEIAAVGGLEMERLAGLLNPPASGPWYRGRPGAGPAEAVEATLIPVVLWVLARRGADLDLVASASASVARLLDAEPSAVAGACLFALALSEMALHDDSLPAPERLGDWLELASRWGGARPNRRMIETVANALSARREGVGAPSAVLLAMARPQAAPPGPLRAAVERVVAKAGSGL